MASNVMQEARAAAGYRERFALDNGNRSAMYVNGELCLKFTYSSHLEYQDANGAIYNTVQKRWVA